jgi:adenine phosphoribosyltransferase
VNVADLLRRRVRDVPDYPRAGVVFKDITPLLADHVAFGASVDAIVNHYGRGRIDKVVGIEARGFIVAAPVAYHFGAGFVPVRKKGKLPASTFQARYEMEYGEATLELHRDALTAGDRVLIVDDVLATGGTAAATRALVERSGACSVGVAVLLELGFLHGRDRLDGLEAFALLSA